MNYSIIGFGTVGQALARAFARKNFEVAVASRRPPEALAPLASEIGPTIIHPSPCRTHLKPRLSSWLSLLGAPRDR